MFGKKLSKEDLEELRKRSEMINQHKLLVQSLELQTQLFIKGLLPKYHCDLNKDYEVDLKSGKIILSKNKQNKTKE